jgi:hypothetical protein
MLKFDMISKKLTNYKSYVTESKDEKVSNTQKDYRTVIDRHYAFVQSLDEDEEESIDQTFVVY